MRGVGGGVVVVSSCCGILICAREVGGAGRDSVEGGFGA